jgi:hypothetical protein
MFLKDRRLDFLTLLPSSSSFSGDIISYQGCQMVYFQTKNHNLGHFWRASDWKMLIYIMMTIWSILRTFGIFYDHLVHFVFIWYILCSFGTFFPLWVSCTKKNLAALFPTLPLRSLKKSYHERNLFVMLMRLSEH